MIGAFELTVAVRYDQEYSSKFTIMTHFCKCINGSHAGKDWCRIKWKVGKVLLS